MTHQQTSTSEPVWYRMSRRLEPARAAFILAVEHRRVVKRLVAASAAVALASVLVLVLGRGRTQEIER